MKRRNLVHVDLLDQEEQGENRNAFNAKKSKAQKSDAWFS